MVFSASLRANPFVPTPLEWKDHSAFFYPFSQFHHRSYLHTFNQILLALIIAGNLQGVANTMDFGVQGNATRTTLFNNTWQGLTLASIGIIVAAAVGILSLVIGAFARAGSPAADIQKSNNTLSVGQVTAMLHQALNHLHFPLDSSWFQNLLSQQISHVVG